MNTSRIVEATAAPLERRVGGRVRYFSPLTFDGIGTLTQHLRGRIVADAIDGCRLAGATGAERDAVIDRALDAASSIDLLRPGSVSRLLDDSTTWARAVWIAALPHDAKLTMNDVVSWFSPAEVSEMADLFIEIMVLSGLCRRTTPPPTDAPPPQEGGGNDPFSVPAPGPPPL